MSEAKRTQVQHICCMKENSGIYQQAIFSHFVLPIHIYPFQEGSVFGLKQHSYASNAIRNILGKDYCQSKNTNADKVIMPRHLQYYITIVIHPLSNCHTEVLLIPVPFALRIHKLQYLHGGEICLKPARRVHN